MSSGPLCRCFTTGLDPQTIYTNFSFWLNATGRPINFNMCEWGVDTPWVWGPKVAQSWRMSGDHTATWESTKSIIQQSAAIPAENTGTPYAWNDMDMLETGCYEQCAHANGKTPNMTATEYMTEFSMWAISASPLQWTAPIMNCTAPPTPPAPVCNLTLVQQLSIDPCTYGTSFGCLPDNNTIWTDNGCRGVFSCAGQNVTCSIDGNGQHVCPCPSGNSANVTCTPWISDLQRAILLNQEVLSVNQDVTPQGRPVNGADLSVWARMLSDGSAAVALVNLNDSEAQLSVSFSSLGWTAGTTAKVRDLWAHQDLGTFTGSYPSSGGVSVAPHQTVLVRITKQ